ncbi:MAG: adenine deaminase [Phycisphaerales bacterium]
MDEHPGDRGGLGDGGGGVGVGGVGGCGFPSARLLAVARGDAPGDVLLRGGRVANVFSMSLEARDVLIADGHVARVVERGGCARGAAEVIDCTDRIVGPGFIDAHMHIESTMLPPSEFVRLAAARGTTSVVADPHEIANVLGADGIRWMVRNGRGLPMNFLWTLSSCVPSCHLETAGAVLSAADLEALFDDDVVGPELVALAEMMNFPGVVHADEEVLKKVRLGLTRRLVDGHAPGLRGDGLQAYVAAGISSDHECTTAEEAAEKLALGMRISIREGSAARNLEALLPLVDEQTVSRFCFCTDDRHPDDLQEHGHIDHIVRRAIELGLAPMMAIRIATLNAAEHYRQARLGAIAPGRQADVVVFDDFNKPTPALVLHAGVVVARDGRYLAERRGISAEEAQRVRVGRTVRLPEGLSAESLVVPVPDGGVASGIRVIGMHADQLVTDHLMMPATVDADGKRVIADAERDVLKLAVIERHTGSGRIGLGFVHGFGFKDGAIASTVGHDAHNLAVVGDNDADMVAAARAVAEVGGGQAVVSKGKVIAVLPLPIAGLMSDADAETVIHQQSRLLYAVHQLGCPHRDPFMPLSFLPLPVIPRLKLSDLGLVDVDRFEVVSLFVGR